jgi:hypothetical protein
VAFPVTDKASVGVACPILPCVGRCPSGWWVSGFPYRIPTITLLLAIVASPVPPRATTNAC